MLIGVALLVAGCGGGSAGSPSPSPAVIGHVADQAILDSTYHDRLQAAEVAIQQAGGPTPGATPGAMERQLQASVMQSLVLDAVIAYMAEQRHVLATDSEIQTELNTEQTDAGGSSALQTQLAEAGGSMDQLRDEIRSRLNEQKLEDTMAQARATVVEQQLAAGGDFASLAKEYSDDPATASLGGDMGVIAPSQLQQTNPEVQKAIAGLADGMTTSTPAHDSQGYEIFHKVADTPQGPHLLRILVAAPNPYTVQNRPAWFTQAVLAELGSLCSENKVAVTSAADPQPCAPATPIAAATP